MSRRGALLLVLLVLRAGGAVPAASQEGPAWDQALLRVQQGQYDSAVAEYLAALRREPQRYELIEQSLLHALEVEPAAAGMAGALEAALARARTEGGADLVPLARLTATCALRRGNAARGLEIISELTRAEGEGDLLFWYASRCEAARQPEVASRAYALLTPEGGDSPYLLVALQRQAEIAARGRDAAQAVALYRRLAASYPGSPEAAQALWHVGRLELEKLGAADRARAALQAALDSPHAGPWREGAAELLAEVALREDDPSTARALLQRLRQQGGGAQYRARYRLAELDYLQLDFAQARPALEALLRQDPAHDLANDALVLLLRCEQLQEAGPAAEHFARAELRERQGRSAEAAPEWAWVAANAPPEVSQLALFTRARILRNRGEVELSAELLRQLASVPQGAYAVAAALGLGELREEQGALQEALRTYETALLAAPEDARAPELRLRIMRLRRLTSG
ncbi:MAG: tetratricopeptide repeat protein [Candidatus Latescibacterota bacterium]